MDSGAFFSLVELPEFENDLALRAGGLEVIRVQRLVRQVLGTTFKRGTHRRTRPFGNHVARMEPIDDRLAAGAFWDVWRGSISGHGTECLGTLLRGSNSVFPHLAIERHPRPLEFRRSPAFVPTAVAQGGNQSLAIAGGQDYMALQIR